jgi:hypothetical protein
VRKRYSNKRSRSEVTLKSRRQGFHSYDDPRSRPSVLSSHCPWVFWTWGRQQGRQALWALPPQRTLSSCLILKLAVYLFLAKLPGASGTTHTIIGLHCNYQAEDTSTERFQQVTVVPSSGMVLRFRGQFANDQEITAFEMSLTGALVSRNIFDFHGKGGR